MQEESITAEPRGGQITRCSTGLQGGRHGERVQAEPGDVRESTDSRRVPARGIQFTGWRMEVHILPFPAGFAGSRQAEASGGGACPLPGTSGRSQGLSMPHSHTCTGVGTGEVMSVSVKPEQRHYPNHLRVLSSVRVFVFFSFVFPFRDA